MNTTEVAELLERPSRGRNTAMQYAARLMRMKDILVPGERKGVMRNWNWMDDYQRVETALWDGTIIRGQNGGAHTEPRSVMAYYCALVAAADCAIPRKKDAAEWYRKGVKACQTHNAEQDKRQELETTRYEHLRWPLPVEIVGNARTLKEMRDAERAKEENKQDLYWTLRHLLYALYVSMRDQCVFRLDVVYKTMLLDPEEAKLEYGNLSSYFVVDVETRDPITLVLGDYKTKRTYGTHTIVMPRAFSDILYDSIERYPRPWFIPSAHAMDRPLSQPNASAFVKSCWVYDDREHTPCADDIRSSLATLYWLRNQRLVDRDAFARRSLTSRATMEASYYKTDPSILASISDSMQECVQAQI